MPHGTSLAWWDHVCSSPNLSKSSTYYVPGTFPGTGDTARNSTDVCLKATAAGLTVPISQGYYGIPEQVLEVKPFELYPAHESRSSRNFNCYLKEEMSLPSTPYLPFVPKSSMQDTLADYHLCPHPRPRARLGDLANCTDEAPLLSSLLRLLCWRRSFPLSGWEHP